MTLVPTEDVRKRLQRLREELKSRQGRAERDLKHGTEPLVADAPDQAIQLQNDEVLREIDSAAVVGVAQIDAALARLDRGTVRRLQPLPGRHRPPPPGGGSVCGDVRGLRWLNLLHSGALVIGSPPVAAKNARG
jgi:hypothetical protein